MGRLGRRSRRPVSPLVRRNVLSIILAPPEIGRKLCGANLRAGSGGIANPEARAPRFGRQRRCAQRRSTTVRRWVHAGDLLQFRLQRVEVSQQVPQARRGPLSADGRDGGGLRHGANSDSGAGGDSAGPILVVLAVQRNRRNRSAGVQVQRILTKPELPTLRQTRLPSRH